MFQKRPLSPVTPIYTSPPIYDRSSTFIATYSPILTPAELRRLPNFADASHRITANRRLSALQPNPQRENYETGYLDDGEKHGGRTLEKVMIEEDVCGAICVARWYGGVMLGPVRFDHMRTCAGEAIWMWRQEEESGNKRRRKESQEEEERVRLVKELPERDQSIVVLRGLLVDGKERAVEDSKGPGRTYTKQATTIGRKEMAEGKTRDTNEAEAGARAARDKVKEMEQNSGTSEGAGSEGDGDHSGVQSEPTAATQERTAPPAYANMPLESLQKLEKVRDASISWILKQIEREEKAEQGVIQSQHIADHIHELD